MIQTFLVEDSPVIRENLIATLEEMVPLHVVGFAETEREAVQWLEAAGNRCQLVIVDLFLRQGSGIHVLEHLGRIEHPAERVVLTNYATADVRRQCLRLGASRVFDKSGEIDALIDHCLSIADRGGPDDAGSPGNSGSAGTPPRGSDSSNGQSGLAAG
jgi:DNA-binding NarL/FixJ family response regulator